MEAAGDWDPSDSGSSPDSGGRDPVRTEKDFSELRTGQEILKYFSYSHLPPSLQDVSAPFGELALKMVMDLPQGTELSVGLRKLLEAKDCFVRAKLG